MSYTHNWGESWKDGTDSASTTTEVVTADGKANFSGLLELNADNEEIDISFPHTPITSVALLAAADTTLYTNFPFGNEGDPPVDTIALVAGKISKWTTSSVNPCPFTADVTKIYAVKTGAAASLIISILYDATP